MRSLAGRLLLSNGLALLATLGVQAWSGAAGQRTMLPAVSGAVLAMVVAWAAAALSVRRPMARLLAAAGRLGNGDGSARTGLVHDRSEFGRLAAALDAVAETLPARDHPSRSVPEGPSVPEEASVPEGTPDGGFALSAAARALPGRPSEREEMLDALGRATPDLMFVKDRAGRVRYANPALLAMLGRAADEVLGQTAAECLADPTVAEAIMAAEERIMTGGVTLTVEQAMPDARRGETRIWQSTKAPLRDPATGEVTGLVSISRDVTEQRRTEEALAASEARLRAATDNARVGLVVVGEDHRYRFANRAYAEILGLPSADIVGLRVSDVLAPLYESQIAARLDRAFGGERVSYELTRPAAAGEPDFTYAVTYEPGRSQAGEPIVVVVISDITPRVQAERALAASEARLRTIVETVPVGLVMAELPSGRIVGGNAYVEQMLRHPVLHSPDIHGYDEWVSFHADGSRVDGHEYPLARMVLGGEENPSLEVHYQRGDGTRAWTRIMGRPVRDAHGALVGGVVALVDVDGERRAREALAESEALLRLFIERAPAAIAMFDADMRYLAVSRRFLADHGFDLAPAAVLGRSHYDLFPEIPERWREIHRRVLAGETLSAEEDTFPRQDGRTDWERWEMTPWHRSDGSVGGTVLFSEVVTARKEAELALARLNHDLEERVRQEMAAREEAQERATQAQRIQALGKLAGGVAHEFNNILQAVRGGVGLIESRAGDEASVRRLAGTVLKAAGRGTGITGRLLAFAKHGNFHSERIEAGTTLEELRDMLAHMLGGQVAVGIDIAPGLPPVLADKAQLETALVNLATNARDAMPDGGTLTLAAAAGDVAEGTAHPAELKPGRYVRFSVADTGTGMDRATLARAVEPFFTTKAVDKGTGLGLSMAKGFAEQSGGALRIESAPGRGTTVSLWLPSPPPVAAARRGERPEAATARPMTRVLVVDDEEMVRETLAAGLEDAGLSVLVAGSGAEALALLEAGETVDAMLTDFAMPGMDGLALIREAQARRPDLPTILLTGLMDETAAMSVGGALTGSYSLLRKPTNLPQLANRIRALCS